MSYLPIGRKGKDFCVPTLPAIADVMAMTKYTPSTTAYVKVSTFSDTIMIHMRPVVVTEDLIVASTIVHKIADANGIAATNPAVSDAEAQLMVTEIKADFNTHVASLAYHLAAGTNLITMANASNEATTVALTNEIAAKLAAHFADTSVHGGAADAVNLAAVAIAALAPATNYATAKTEMNLLVTAWIAHIAVTDVSTFITYPAATMPVIWATNSDFWAKTGVSGHSFVVAEFLVS